MESKRALTALVGALLLLLGTAFVPSVAASSHDDAGPDLPLTVYEEPDIPPQALDYDPEAKMFPQHPGWLDGKHISYYKFRMYVPPNYGTNDGGLDKVPVSSIYLPTTTGGFDGVPDGQHAIIAEFPTAGNLNYSDFVEVVLVEVDAGYVANSLASVQDVLDSGAELNHTGIIANVPVVPTGSWLEHPEEPDTPAPIDPLTVLYNGMEAQAFVFEVTDDAAADHFNGLTRTGEAAEDGSGFEVTVSSFATVDNGLEAAPIWHVNQYFTGVTPGVNNGGPSDMGQRNIIATDRLMDDYSPLWQVYWITQLPPNYNADDARDNDVINADNGMPFAVTPMYVNCPNVGAHGGWDAEDVGKDAFDTSPTLEEGDTVRLEGALIMEGDATVTLLHGGEHEMATTTTNMMGGYSFEVGYDMLTPGENSFSVVNDAGDTVAEWTLTKAGDDAMDGTDGMDHGDGADDGMTDGDDGAMDGEDGTDRADEPTQTPGVGVLLAALAAAVAALIVARRD